MESVCANVSGDLFLLILSVVSPDSVKDLAVLDSLFEVYNGIGAVEFRVTAAKRSIENEDQ